MFIKKILHHLTLVTFSNDVMLLHLNRKITNKKDPISVDAVQ
jgi:hypothetical protein